MESTFPSKKSRLRAFSVRGDGPPIKQAHKIQNRGVPSLYPGFFPDILLVFVLSTSPNNNLPFGVFAPLAPKTTPIQIGKPNYWLILKKPPLHEDTPMKGRKPLPPPLQNRVFKIRPPPA